MKIIVCMLLLVAAAAAAPGATYTSRFDNVNLDEIMENDRLLLAYINCLLEKGRCTAEGRELKSHIREALETRCAKCTDAQKRGTRRMIGYLINFKPEHWTLLTDKYDPDHKFTKHYENELKTIKA